MNVDTTYYQPTIGLPSCLPAGLFTYLHSKYLLFLITASKSALYKECITFLPTRQYLQFSNFGFGFKTESEFIFVKSI